MSQAQPDTKSKSSESPPAKKKSMFSAFQLMAAVFVAGTLIQQVVQGGKGFSEAALLKLAMVMGLIAFLATMGAGFSDRRRRFLTSMQFAVPALVMLTLLSLLGTLILQKPTEAVLQEAYGPNFSLLIKGLFLHDIFHAFGFCALMGMGSGGLALVVARKRGMTLRYLGAVGAHLGCLFLLAGAVVGNVWGLKGRLNMHVGQTADHFFVAGDGGKMTSQPLGFTVRLDKFELEHYQPDYRLMVFDMKDGGEDRLASVDPTGKDLSRLRELGIELLDYWPDHYVETQVENMPEGSVKEDSPAALALKDLSVKNEAEAIHWLVDRGKADGGRMALGDGQELAFFWQPARAEAFLGSQGDAVTTPHRLLVGKTEIPVELGKSYAIPGTDLRVEIKRAFHHFIIDAQTKQPANRSPRPENPAIEVAILTADGQQKDLRWLFTKFPDFKHQDAESAAMVLNYRYTGAQQSSRVVALYVGQTMELWKGLGSEALEKLTIAREQEFDLGSHRFALASLHQGVYVRRLDRSRSDQALQPLLRLRVLGMEQIRRLGPRQPLRFGDQKVLVLAPKGGETVRDYLSTVSVYEQGKKVLTTTIEVNYPLVHNGYALFQSDYRPEDPTFSGFQVGRDPGLVLVYIGLLMLSAGVLLALYGPNFRRRRQAKKAGGES